VELGAEVLHEVHDKAVASTREDQALEARRILTNVETAAQRGRDLGQHEAAALEGRLLRREQSQVVGRSMSEVKAASAAPPVRKNPRSR